MPAFETPPETALVVSTMPTPVFAPLTVIVPVLVFVMPFDVTVPPLTAMPAAFTPPLAVIEPAFETPPAICD
jgi:hypothetical protein